MKTRLLIILSLLFLSLFVPINNTYALSCALPVLGDDGVCIVNNPLDCDLDDPYDYECGVADPSRTMDRETEVILTILLIVIPITLFTVGIIIWKKRKTNKN